MSRKIIPFILSCLFSFMAIAQEVVTPLIYNQQLVRDVAQAQKKQNNQISPLALGDTLDLPFMDDFSKPGLYADESLWQRNFDVFINNSMPYNPPTYGVATFDGVNDRGFPYNFLFASSFGIADTLRSQPLRLDSLTGIPLTAADSVYLSFYVQPQGRGNAPEIEDSLVLYFKAKIHVNDTTIIYPWVRVWGMAGKEIGADTNAFKSVLIAVADSQFFYKGFQFMFMNYSTLSGFVDVWNLDNVRLAANRTYVDTVYNDVAFVSMSSTLLKNYHEMPWTHFLADQTNQKKNSFNNKICNLFNDVRNLHYTYSIIDNTGTTLFTQPDSPENILALTCQDYVPQINPAFNFSFPAQAGDSATFTLVNTITTTPDLNRWNDTIFHHQGFYNYYAYDDGSVENGYGLNALGGKIAYKFTPVMSDTLRGAFMYFVKMLENVGLRTFKIKVWDASGPSGSPGNVMYQTGDVTPMYRDWLNTFYFYNFANPLYINIANTPTIYIGWEQNTADLLNIGLDINNNSQANMFFNTTGVWYSSLIQGSWMIRPAFGKAVPAEINIGFPEMKLADNQQLILYPNPANNKLYIQFADAGVFVKDKISISVFNMLGEKVFASSVYTNEIDVTSLPSGFYILKAESDSRNFHSVQKFVISR